MMRFDRSSLLAAAIVVVALLLGVVSGVALDRWLLRPPRELAARRPGLAERERRFDPAQFRMQFGGQLARELRLTPAQREAVDSLLKAQGERSRAVMREMRPRLQQVAESTQAALREVLSDEQWATMQRLREQRMRRGGPRRRGGLDADPPQEVPREER